MKKTKEPATELSLGELRKLLIDITELDDQIDGLEALRDQKKAVMLANLKTGGILQHMGWRCTVVSPKTRKIKWKDMCYSLAHKMYPDKVEFRSWVKRLARKYPKSPIKEYIKITPVKEEG